MNRGGIRVVRFQADSVTIDDAFDESILVGVSNRDDRRQAIHFQRLHRAEPNDGSTSSRRYWMYYDENGTQHGACGQINRINLSRNRLIVQIDGAVARVLGDEEFQIDFLLSEVDFEYLLAGLRLLFAGSDRFIENV